MSNFDTRRWEGLMAVAAMALVVTFAGACASGGSAILSRTSLTADDFAQANYQTVYDFLKAHSRARFVSSVGQEFLTVYTRGGSMRTVDYGGRNTNPGFGEQGSEDPPSPVPAAARVENYDGALLYVNGQEVQGSVVQVLKQTRLSEVASLKILRPSETSARYGGDGRVGAVVIIMKGYEES